MIRFYFLWGIDCVYRYILFINDGFLLSYITFSRFEEFKTAKKCPSSNYFRSYLNWDPGGISAGYLFHFLWGIDCVYLFHYSGFLLSYLTFPRFEELKTVKRWALFYFHRYWRYAYKKQITDEKRHKSVFLLA